MPRKFALNVLSVPCPLCNAGIDAPCRSRGQGAHLARTKALKTTHRRSQQHTSAIDRERAAQVKAAARGAGLGVKRHKVKTYPTYNPGRGLLPPADAQVLFASLRRLNLRNLAAYYETHHWQKFRHDWKFTSGRYRCVVCGDGYNHLHHRSYERLGAEGPEDVVPVCKECHEATHETLLDRRPGVTLWNAHEHTGRPRKYG